VKDSFLNNLSRVSMSSVSTILVLNVEKPRVLVFTDFVDSSSTLHQGHFYQGIVINALT
jgi:hypothetical protein